MYSVSVTVQHHSSCASQQINAKDIMNINFVPVEKDLWICIKPSWMYICSESQQLMMLNNFLLLKRRLLSWLFHEVRGFSDSNLKWVKTLLTLPTDTSYYWYCYAAPWHLNRHRQ